MSTVKRAPRRKRFSAASLSVDRSVDMPTIKLMPVMSTRVRYSSAGIGVTGNYTAQELLSFTAIGLAGATANTLCSAVRIRKIEIWVQTSAASSQAPFGLQWNTGAGTIGAPTSITYDTPSTTSFPGHASYRPPSGSFADMWHSAIGDSTPVFYLFAAPTAGIVYIDITYDYTINFTQSPNVAVGIVGASAIAGELGFSSFSGRLVPSAPLSSINIY